MDPTQTPIVYTFYDEVGEIDPATWFSLTSIPARFICPTDWLQSGDKVKVTIQRCPASPITQPEPQSNS